MMSGLESELKSEIQPRAAKGGVLRASGREGGCRQPAEEAPGQTAPIVENDARHDGLAIPEHAGLIAHGGVSAIYRRHCEEQSDEAIQLLLQQLRDGLLRRKCSSQ